MESESVSVTSEELNDENKAILEMFEQLPFNLEDVGLGDNLDTFMHLLHMSTNKDVLFITQVSRDENDELKLVLAWVFVDENKEIFEISKAIDYDEKTKDMFESYCSDAYDDPTSLTEYKFTNTNSRSLIGESYVTKYAGEFVYIDKRIKIDVDSGNILRFTTVNNSNLQGDHEILAWAFLGKYECPTIFHKLFYHVKSLFTNKLASLKHPLSIQSLMN